MVEVGDIIYGGEDGVGFRFGFVLEVYHEYCKVRFISASYCFITGTMPKALVKRVWKVELEQDEEDNLSISF
jgi:hypothetical protein